MKKHKFKSESNQNLHKININFIISKLIILLFVFGIFAYSCGENPKRSPGGGNTYSFPKNTPDSFTDNPDDDDNIEVQAGSITITVSDADLANTNKSTPAPAVQLWAVTTLYETSGYETEKIKLTDQGGGVWSGILPLVDNILPRSVIIFDDVVINPHPYNGIPYSGPSPYGSGSHYIFETNNYFSPCSGPVIDNQSAGVLLVLDTPDGNIQPPRLPSYLNTVASNNTPFDTDEIYTIVLNQKDGDFIPVDYAELDQADNSLFCNCLDNLRIVTSNTSGSYATFTTHNINDQRFTDANFEKEDGGCLARMNTEPTTSSY